MVSSSFSTGVSANTEEEKSTRFSNSVQVTTEVM
jgi:hypothetical protein